MNRLAALAAGAALLLCLGAQAQTPAPTPKKDLVTRILAQQQGGIEMLANSLAEQSIAPMLGQIGPALSARVPADKRQAVAEQMKADVKKYIDDASALLRERAVKLAPTTVGAALEEKFSEDELRQLLAVIESPINRKYQQIGNELQKDLIDKLVADTRASIDPKLKALDEALVGRLNAAASSAASPPKATSAPRKP